MGTSLVGLLPQNTYVGLIKVGNNTALNATLKTLSDGAGNDLPMQASTTAINFTGTTTGLASGVSGAIQFSNGSAFASDAANLFWDDTNNRLGVGTNAPTRQVELVGSVASPAYLALRYGTATGGGPVLALDAGSAGLNYLIISTTSSNGSVGANGLGIFDGTDYRFVIKGGNVGIGETTPTSRLHIKGSGSTSATTSLLVQNSAGTEYFRIKDDGQTNFNSTINAISVVATNNINFQNILFSNNFWSQPDGGTRIGGGTAAPVASAILQVDSTTKGFLPPRMTTTQKNAIASPASGLQVFDSTMNATCEYNGTGWRVVSAGAQSVSVTGALQGISFANGNVANIDMQSSTTFSFTNATIGTYILKITQGGAGGYVAFWPANVYWSGGTAPVLTGPIGKTDIITLVYDGTNYYGNYSLNY